MKKAIDEGREIGLDARMQAGNVAAFIPRLRAQPTRNQPPLEPGKTAAGGAPPEDDDPGPSAA